MGDERMPVQKEVEGDGDGWRLTLMIKKSFQDPLLYTHTHSCALSHPSFIYLTP